MAKDFQTGKFADFEQFKIDSHFSNFRQVQRGPWHRYGLSHLNWMSQLINRLQGFNLLLLSIAHFADLCSKIEYAW